VYFSQTGQLARIVDSIKGPLENTAEIEVIVEQLVPEPSFPFPWTADEFFQAMPESVLGIPCDLRPLTCDTGLQYDLIVIAWQPWYLSPSIPTHAFFRSEAAKKLIKGRPVISVIGCRNMWVMAYAQVKEYILKLEGVPAGNIVLFDRAPNLLSIVSVIRWMMKGKQDRYLGIFPPSGVSNEDISQASSFGEIMHSALLQNEISSLRSRLIHADAIEIKPGLVMIEKRGIILFGIWARFIRRKGIYGSKERLGRIRLFKYYLIAVIYLVSPFATALYWFVRPFRMKSIKKQKAFYQQS